MVNKIAIALRYSGELSLNTSPERVRRTLFQIDELIKCLPGYKRHEMFNERKAKIVVEVVIGPISGDVDIMADIVFDNDIVIKGEGSGLLSKMSFVLKLKIEEKEKGALLKWSFEGVLEGLAAKFDKRLIDYVAQTWIDKMKDELRKKLEF